MEMLEMFRPTGVEGSITNSTLDNTVQNVEAASKVSEQTYRATHEEHINTTINKETESNYKPQELKTLTRDSVGKHKDTFHIIEYKYVLKKK